MIETYLKLLQFEGRLSDKFTCFYCQQNIQDNRVVVTRGFLQAHTSCLYKNSILKEKLYELFNTFETISLDDNEIDMLWRVVEEGF